MDNEATKIILDKPRRYKNTNSFVPSIENWQAEVSDCGLTKKKKKNSIAFEKQTIFRISKMCLKNIGNINIRKLDEDLTFLFKLRWLDFGCLVCQGLIKNEWQREGL